MSTKYKLPQNSMAFGEVSPEGQAREDINAYGQALKKCLNWSLLLEGGAERRSGMEWIGQLPGAATGADFEFDESQQYIFLFSAGALDIWDMDDTAPDQLPTLTKLAQVTTNADWTESDLDTLVWVSRGDTMFICSNQGTFQMKEIKRTSATTFVIEDYEFEVHSSGAPTFQPYFKFEPAAVTLTPSATTGSITLTASADVFNTSNLHDNVIFRLGAVGSEKEVRIDSVTSATVANATVLETLAGTSATADWDEAVFSPARGWQRSVLVAEKRLWIGGSRDFKFNIWGSNISAFKKFEVDAGNDDEMIDRPLDSSKIEEIRGLVHGDNIEVYSDQGTHYIPLSDSVGLTPDNTAIRSQTTYGSRAAVRPLSYDGATVFMQRTGMVAREYIFDETNDKYNATPLSLLSSHLFKNIDTEGKENAASMAGSAVLHSTVRRPESYWMTVNRGTGQAILLHSLRREGVTGWFRWSSPGATDDVIHDIFTVGHQTFCVVKRTVATDPFSAAFSTAFGAGTQNYHLERLEPDFSLDHAKRVSVPSPRRVFTGFSHLAGYTVDVVSRQKVYHGAYTVAADGSITIDQEDVEIVAGFDYPAEIETLRPRFAANGFTISGEIKRLARFLALLESAYTFQVNGTDLIIRKVSDNVEDDPSPESGYREFTINGYSRDGTVTIKAAEPLPVKLTGFTLEVIV